MKGKIEEILNKIKHDPNEDSKEYHIVYRDFEYYKRIPYDEWNDLLKEESIPYHRITQILKNNNAIFTKPGFCEKCGKPLKSHMEQNKQK